MQKVFISWSGDRSKAVAKALHGWLPSVNQLLRPFMSEEDIKKGSRWGPEIAVQLQDARFGLICLTPENLEAPWILFEAGALSKKLGDLVCPYLFGLQPSDIQEPLSQFQAAKAEKEDTKKLVYDINKACDSFLTHEQVEKQFEKWWPELEAILGGISAPKKEVKPQRTEREILEEMLGLLRRLARDDRSTENALQTILGALDPHTQSRTSVWGPLIGENPYRRLRGPSRNLRSERPDEAETPPTDVSGGPKST